MSPVSFGGRGADAEVGDAALLGGSWQGEHCSYLQHPDTRLWEL